MVIYETGLGKCLCEDSLNVMKRTEKGSVDLIMTSPPFALQRKKAYGNESQEEYIDWIRPFAREAFRILKNTGSFVIDLGGAYMSGHPEYSLYQFRVLIMLCDEIGFRLAQPFYWHNPSALPAPIEWVNKRKLRAKNSVNTVWWLCKDSDSCKADVRRVLVPYSDRMKRLIQNPEEFVAKEGTRRPSGHVLGKSTWANDNGGAIPPNMLNISNTESNSKYLRYVKELGVKGHPARFPERLPEFFIELLTDPGDLVMDIFAGSNTTGAVAEKLKRRWISSELNKEYAVVSYCRFASSEEDAKRLYQVMIK